MFDLTLNDFRQLLKSENHSVLDCFGLVAHLSDSLLLNVHSEMTVTVSSSYYIIKYPRYGRYIHKGLRKKMGKSNK